ncbi:hypothetical protein [Methylocella sp.]|uniref:hypothetical protein n=1 Tax=Methylocella sp. TaxID=1978226 RepID=UPI0037835775
MPDDVTIRLSADASELQRGLREAADAFSATVGAFGAGAQQVSASFAVMSQAAQGASAGAAASARAANETQIAIARQGEEARYAVAQNGLKAQASLIREEAQTGRMSRQEELAALIANEREKEDAETRHFRSVQELYAQGTLGFARAQRELEEIASQSALRRQEIEREVNQQIFLDYRRSFQQIGSSVTSSMMGLVTGQQTLAQAAQRIALSIVQAFVAARVRLVADWLAGLATNTAATTAAETAQTGAVTAGAAMRSSVQTSAAAASSASVMSGVMKSIMASAGETFAGIFGFLSPVMGPAAAGPAAAGQATVLGVASGLASFAVGAWNLPSDMVAQVHQGEMIIPAGPAAAVRSAFSQGAAPGASAQISHSTNFTVQALDASGVKQFFRTHGRQILRTINDGVRTGSHLGLSKLGRNI